jgi:hypothetical protein
MSGQRMRWIPAGRRILCPRERESAGAPGIALTRTKVRHDLRNQSSGGWVRDATRLLQTGESVSQCRGKRVEGLTFRDILIDHSERSANHSTLVFDPQGTDRYRSSPVYFHTASPNSRDQVHRPRVWRPFPYAFATAARPRHPAVRLIVHPCLQLYSLASAQKRRVRIRRRGDTRWHRCGMSRHISYRAAHRPVTC